MFKSKGRLATLFLAMVMVLGSFPLSAQAVQTNTAESSFDQMLEQLRQELFSPARAMQDTGRVPVYVEMDDMQHTPPDFSSPADDGSVGIVPFGFVEQDYQEGSTRLFRAQIRPNSTLYNYVQGNLVRQGQHVNIWVLDLDAYIAALGPELAAQLVPQNSIGGQHVSTRLNENAALLDDMAARIDGIIGRVTQGFGPFAGVKVTTPYASMPYVGDVHNDGRVNVLLYNIQGSGVGIGGFFRPTDFSITSGGSTPLAMMHIDLNHAYTSAMTHFNNPAHVQAGFYYTFAHELQHLLFYMHFGVYLTNTPIQRQFLWFNEALSDYAGHFYTAPGVELVLPAILSGIFNASVNSYATTGGGLIGDFVNFNNSSKNYAMGRLHATLMHRITGGTYARDVYSFFNAAFPHANTAAEFNANRNNILSAGMSEIIGNAFNAAGLTGSTGATGEDAFALLYFLFMENFAADGGNIVSGNAAHTTIPFHTSQLSAHRLWGIRPTLGIGRVYDISVQMFHIPRSLVAFTPLPSLAPGATVSMSGFNGTPIRGATHERVYRLVGESAANPILTISIDDNDPMTRFYVAVPNDAPGSVSFTPNVTLGGTGATVYPLAGNNAVNIIDTGGQVAYLFVATLFRNVSSVVVDYSWGADAATVTGVTVSPLASNVQQGGSQNFTANVAGSNNPSQAVTWSVEGSVNLGTAISADGVLTIAADETATTLTVRATSLADVGVSGTAVVTVIGTAGPTPTPIPLPTVSPMIGGGLNHTLALRYDGTVWAWGSNYRGELGDGRQGTGTNRYMPMHVRGLYDVVQVVSNERDMSTVLRSDGTIWSWGWAPYYFERSSTPMLLADLDDIVAVARGSLHTIALRSDGTVLSWAYYRNGMPDPVIIDGVIAISASNMRSLALRYDGTVWTWGVNIWGHYGPLIPIQIQGLYNVVAIDTGADHSIVLKSDGTVWSWGRGRSGVLGHSNGADSHTPRRVQVVSDIIAISAGRLHNVALRSDGTVWAWGESRSGQSGIANGTVWTPIQIQGLNNVMHVSASAGSHSIAVTDDGYVWAWGNNAAYQLGDGTTIDRSYPVQVLGPHNGRLNLLPHQAHVPTITGVTVSPATAYVQLGGSRNFAADVEGINNIGPAGQAVTWTVEGSVNSGTVVSAGGVLTVAGDETAVALTVRATSVVDTGVSGTAVVSVIGDINSWVELRETINTAPEGIPTVIRIGSSFAAPEGVPAGNVIEIPAGRHITLVSSDITEGPANVRTLTQPNTWPWQRHFNVNDGSSLIICQNVTLYRGGIQVNSGGEFAMNSGSVIEYSAGVLLTFRTIHDDVPARFTMRGGAIRYSGNGVYNRRGNFVMYDGYIHDNTATTGGGVRNFYGVFIMHGGTISNNFASAGGGGVINHGEHATFTMRGGKIVGNSSERIVGNSSTGGVSGGGGVLNIRGTVTMYDGLISGNRNEWTGGGGVHNASGTFIMNGGEIYGNSARRLGGGGVLNSPRFSTHSGASGGIFIMNGGRIAGNWLDGLLNTNGLSNTVLGGAGVHNGQCGIFNMYGGEIYDNVSRPNSGDRHNTFSGRGGGIYNVGNFTMHNGRIAGNTITATNRYDGGGVFNRGYFTMYDGVIYSNGRRNHPNHGTRDCNIANVHVFIKHGGVIICNRLGYIDIIIG